MLALSIQVSILALLVGTSADPTWNNRVLEAVASLQTYFIFPSAKPVIVDVPGELSPAQVNPGVTLRSGIYMLSISIRSTGMWHSCWTLSSTGILQSPRKRFGRIRTRSVGTVMCVRFVVSLSVDTCMDLRVRMHAVL